MSNLLDQVRGANLWTEQDRNMFNRLPIYFAKTQTDYIKWFARWSKILKPMRWEQNSGTVMQGVRKEPSPILRATAFPNPMTSAPRKDVVEVRELAERCQLYRHNFESNLMHFVPSFYDFLTDHVDYTVKDLTQKVQMYQEIFYRTAVLHASPYIYVCGKNPQLTPSPFYTGEAVTEAKTQPFWQEMIGQCNKTLDLRNIALINQIMFNDLGVEPFSGNMAGDGSNGEGLKYKYCLIMGNEPWQNFVFDPYLQNNRQINLDIVTDQFTGSLFGRFTCLFERFELRLNANGEFEAPETIEEGVDTWNRGQVIPRPGWVNGNHAIAFACGADGYKSINSGPPPAEFARGEMSMSKFRALNWNGKVDITKDVLVPSLDQNGNTVMDTNKRGEYLQLLSDITMGILPINRRNILPILYQRQRVAAN